MNPPVITWTVFKEPVGTWHYQPQNTMHPSHLRRLKEATEKHLFTGTKGAVRTRVLELNWRDNPSLRPPVAVTKRRVYKFTFVKLVGGLSGWIVYQKYDSGWSVAKRDGHAKLEYEKAKTPLEKLKFFVEGE